MLFTSCWQATVSADQVGFEEPRARAKSLLSVLVEGDGQVENEQAMGFNFLTVEFCPVNSLVVGKDAIYVLLKKADQLFERNYFRFYFSCSFNGWICFCVMTG